MSRRLRIGIVTDGLEEATRNGGVEIKNGGVGVYIHQLVQSLLAIDRPHEYFLIHGGAGRLDLYRDRRAHDVELPGTTFHRYARWLDLPYRRVARELGLDLVHYPNQFGGVFLPAPPRRVVTLHDLTPLLFPRHHPFRSVAGYRLLMPSALRAADRVLVDSEATRHDLLAHTNVAPAKVVTIPLGVTPAFHPGATTPGFDGRFDCPERFILTVGVLEPRKNHRVLFEALERLHAAGERLGLVIAGRDGWGWRNPLEEPRFASLRPWVRIFRNVPDGDLPELYARAAVFAYPSFYEGFGLPVLEAMATGTPVVASDAAAIPEVAGEAALLVDPRDATGFADAIGRLLRDDALRQRLTRAGRERAAQMSWETTARRTLDVYESVCAEA